MEKVLVTEIPGVHWKQSGKSKHGTGLTDAERDEIRATKVKKDKICLYCLVEVLNGVRKKVTRTMTRGKYWLCRRHVGRFVAWRQENRDRVEEGRGNVHIVYERKH
ncbi:MAG: hypothetical protein ACXABF_17240 [Candidatus Thorarchaeota archaeon]|jgi:hypothetical protein